MKLLVFAFLMGRVIWAAEVLMVSENQLSMAISHQPESPWVLGDRVCAHRGSRRVACGSIIRMGESGAVVSVSRSYDTIVAGLSVQRFETPKGGEFESPTPDPFDWHDQANFTIGTLMMSPHLHFQQALSSKFAMGILPVWLRTSGGTTNIEGLGTYVTVNYYFSSLYHNMWLLGGAGVYLYKGTVGTTSEELVSPSLMGALGWRFTLGSGFNFSIGVGAQYLLSTDFKVIAATFAGMVPLGMIDVGWYF